MKLRLYNAKILTMAGESPEILEGEIRIDGDRITSIGGAELPRDSFDREIDCGGNLLMPGFKNAHTHSGMTFLRSRADDLPLQAWLNEQVFPYEAKLTADDIWMLTKLAILEYATTGVTGCMEMYLTPYSIAKAFEECGMRLVQVGSVNNFSQSPELLEEWYNELNGKNPLTSFELGFHAQYTCSEELIERFAALAAKYKAPVYTHLCETESETRECIETWGKTPVAYLADKGIFDYGGAGYHLVHTTREDLAIMKEKGIGVVTNAGSNTKLASGIAPISDYLEAGIPVAIGTDGPASNNCLDMFREMFLVTGLGKLRTKDASAIPFYEVLKMACVNGARIMRTFDADCLAPGKLADIIMIDLHQPNMQPINNIAANIVYAGSKMNIAMTMVGGNIIYDTFGGGMHFHVGTDPEEIYRKSTEIRERICG